MLQDLDQTLKELLAQNLTRNWTTQSGFSFAPPSQDIMTNGKPATISLFLYDVRENLELRSGVRSGYLPKINDSNTESGNSKTPRTKIYASTRVDCSYIITVWIKDSGKEHASDNALQEHELLGNIMQVLMLYRTIPSKYLYGSLRPPDGSLQPPDLPMLVVSFRSGQLQNLGEFWQAMGGKPKTSLNCTITISVPPVNVQNEEEYMVKQRILGSRNRLIKI